MKKLGVYVASSLFALVCGATPALAADAASGETLQAAKELASLTSSSAMPQLVNNLTQTAWPGVEGALKLKNPTLDNATLSELRKEFERLQVMIMLEALSDSAPVFARYFTAQELREIIAFYRTPTGTKALTAMPQASMELLAALPPRIQALSTSVNARFAAILKERGFNP